MGTNDNIENEMVIIRSVVKRGLFLPNEERLDISKGDVTIPELVIDKNGNLARVTKIGKGAFKANVDLTSISLPDSVTEIQHNAFAGCTNLTHVNMGRGLKGIRGWAFRDCISLKSFDAPESLEGIGTSVFQGCLSLTSISLTSIVNDEYYDFGSWNFSDCPSLRKIVVPSESFEKIGESILSGSNLPVSVSTIDHGRERLVLSANLTKDMVANGVVDQHTGKPATLDRGHVRVPSSIIDDDGNYCLIHGISNGAFENNAEIKTIFLPPSVKDVGENAFRGCTNLITIVMRDTAKNNLRVGAFDHCPHLANFLDYYGHKVVSTIGRADISRYVGMFTGCPLMDDKPPVPMVSIGRPSADVSMSELGEMYKRCPTLQPVNHGDYDDTSHIPNSRPRKAAR